MLYAVWYDNSSGYLEAFQLIEANNPADAITKGRAKGLMWSVNVVITEATQNENGFGNDPNINKGKVLATSSAEA